MGKTQLNKLHIEHFRALENVDIEFGNHITVVCGKNGTSKSSILGIAAQIFSFEKDYARDKELSFVQIAGGSFKSQYSEHFRISKKFDVPGSMKVNIELLDGYSGQAATAKLELMKRANHSRPVVRNNSTAPEQSSRNFTHPVIFLSLKRLYPIADRTYKVIELDRMDDKEEFIALNNELLSRSSSLATGTGGTINSAVAHGANYDHESVSAGEDNAGQIILALMSFRKLRKEYPDYKGGLLLIDEADAGLFPAAQINLLKILDRECRSMNLQVIMTSHSPTLIEYAFEQSQVYRKNYKTIYLCNTYGDVQVMQDWSWAQISADISIKTIATATNTLLPKVNVYFEDKEAADLFAALMVRQPLKKFIAPLRDVSLGCSNYLNLINAGVRDFSERGVVCLDGDTAHLLTKKHPKTVVLLPGGLAPDRLIFQYLYNLPAGHEFWRNELQYSRENFKQSAAEVISKLRITGNTVDITERELAYTSEPNESKKVRAEKLREIFKRFYKDPEFQKLVGHATKPYNPWKHWVDNNPEATNQFLSQFEAALRGVMKKGFNVPAEKLSAIQVKLKKA
ncbi:MAG: AAA family ATPase [Flavobacteriales bacterium]|nr:AAA family ATPase [Flavobacteriales bacterium]